MTVSGFLPSRYAISDVELHGQPVLQVPSGVDGLAVVFRRD